MAFDWHLLAELELARLVLSAGTAVHWPEPGEAERAERESARLFDEWKKGRFAE